MVEWPLTFKCNNNCISCIMDSRITEKMGNPTFNQIKRYIDMIPQSCDTIGFTGGEPTLRKEFFEILKYARKTHPESLLFVVSNGRMFKYEWFVKKLVDLDLGNIRIGVAMYSHNPDIHDAITRSKGSFNDTYQGIKNLIKYKVRTELRIIVNKLNYKTIEDTAEFIAGNFRGIERVVFINMKYTGNAFINRDKIFVRYKELVPYVQKAVDILLKHGFETRLFHFPLCTIDKKYWDLAKGVTKQKYELCFLKVCENCKMKDVCPMIWKTYVVLAGEDEFKAII